MKSLLHWLTALMVVILFGVVTVQAQEGVVSETEIPVVLPPTASAEPAGEVMSEDSFTENLNTVTLSPSPTAQNPITTLDSEQLINLLTVAADNGLYDRVWSALSREQQAVVYGAMSEERFLSYECEIYRVRNAGSRYIRVWRSHAAPGRVLTLTREMTVAVSYSGAIRVNLQLITAAVGYNVQNSYRVMVSETMVVPAGALGIEFGIVETGKHIDQRCRHRLFFLFTTGWEYATGTVWRPTGDYAQPFYTNS